MDGMRKSNPSDGFPSPSSEKSFIKAENYESDAMSVESYANYDMVRNPGNPENDAELGLASSTRVW